MSEVACTTASTTTSTTSLIPPRTSSYIVRMKEARRLGRRVPVDPEEAVDSAESVPQTTAQVKLAASSKE